MEQCRQCGQTRNLDSPYCAYCGASHTDSSTAQQSSPQQAPYTPPSQYSQPSPYASPSPYSNQAPYAPQQPQQITYQGPPQQPQQMMPPVHSQYGYNVPPTYNVQPKDKIAAALLAFFLGSFGVHGFYLGNNTMGVTMLVLTLSSILLTCIFVGIFGFFIVGIIQIIQTILYLVASDQEFHQKYVVEKRWF